MVKSVFAAVLLLIATVWVSPSGAATLIIDGQGRLTGATGVLVGGTLYNVAFADGTCADLFDGCDEQSDFLFADLSSADAAAAALTNQVFLDSSLGLFNSSPNETWGCSIVSCTAYVPYSISEGNLSQIAAYNFPLAAFDENMASDRPQANYDLIRDVGGVYAVFSVPSVPEPGTWAMMLIGFAGIGLSVRRSRVRLRA